MHLEEPGQEAYKPLSQYIISGLTESHPIFGRIVTYLQGLNSSECAVGTLTSSVKAREI